MLFRSPSHDREKEVKEIDMDKIVVTEVENAKLYESFSRAVDSFRKLAPAKYESLQTICYSDALEDIYIPKVREVKPEYDVKTTVRVASLLCDGCLASGYLDYLCREVM